MMWNIEYTMKRYIDGKYQYTTYYVPVSGAKPEIAPFPHGDKHSKVSWETGDLLLNTQELIDLRIVPYNTRSNT